MSVLTEDAPQITDKYGTVLGNIMVFLFIIYILKNIFFVLGSFITVICGMKFLRNGYSDQNCQYLIVTFTALISKFDCRHLNETFLVAYFFVSIAYYKIHEFLLKVSIDTKFFLNA